jgi:1-acyl-sn-glycerol-3-phosphate acyltransferase
MLRSGFGRTVVSLWSWLVFAVVVVVWLPLVAVTRLATAPVDNGRYAAGLLFRRAAVVHEQLNPLWRFTTSGPVPDDPRRPYVVVANHESFVDILLIAHLPWEMKWLSKREFFRFPVMGWMMRLVGDVPLVRGDAASVAKAMAQCRVWLDRKVSVMIFPEGTRSRSGELQPFKDGAFALAVDAGVPILPVAVYGTRDALVTHDWRFGYARAEARVLEPVTTEGLTAADVADLRDRVRARIEAEVALMRAGS